MEDLAEKWEMIPSDVDILVTHMPPYGIKDENEAREKQGSPDLLKTVTERVRPRVHLFGHIHESHGWSRQNDTLFINASVKKPDCSANRPFVVDYYRDRNKVEIAQ